MLISALILWCWELLMKSQELAGRESLVAGKAHFCPEQLYLKWSHFHSAPKWKKRWQFQSNSSRQTGRFPLTLHRTSPRRRGTYLSSRPVKAVAVGLHQQTAAFSRHQLALGLFWRGELHVAEGPIALHRLTTFSPMLDCADAFSFSLAAPWTPCKWASARAWLHVSWCSDQSKEIYNWHDRKGSVNMLHSICDPVEHKTLQS